MRDRFGVFLLGALGLLVITMIAIGTTSSGSGKHDDHNLANPTSIQIPTSSPGPGNTSHAAEGTHSIGGSSGGSATSSATVCSGSIAQTQLQTKALREGQTRHTRVAPFGCVTVYKIKPFDTLFDIANTFAVHGAYLTLYQWNQSVVGKDPDLIHPGQVVIVDPTGAVLAPTK